MNKNFYLLIVLLTSGCAPTDGVIVESAATVAISDQVSTVALRNKQTAADLEFEKHLYKRELINGDLYSYYADGLKVYALLNTPRGVMPEQGFPVLIYGHGFHPEPKKYGVTSEGVVRRPGDYYRGIPERYAQEGYLVISPDYRGHNISQGFEYTQRDSLSSSYYASDVLHLLSAVDGLKQANPDKIFYAGHSMGGDVGLKMLLATTKVRAASLWSPAIGSTAQRALYYGRYYDPDPEVAVDLKKLSEYRQGVDKVYQQFAGSVSNDEVDAVSNLNYLSTPLIIQHARGDRSVPYQWAENLVVKLAELDKDFLFYSYNSDAHLFKGEDLEKAFQRDLTFFKRH